MHFVKRLVSYLLSHFLIAHYWYVGMLLSFYANLVLCNKKSFNNLIFKNVFMQMVT